jgi:hypothetical protein
VQQNFLNLSTKATYRLSLVCRTAEFFELRTKHGILFSRAAKILEFSNRSSSNQLYFVLLRRNFWTANKNTVFYSGEQRKILVL